jgi:hypothetical protein
MPELIVRDAAKAPEYRQAPAPDDALLMDTWVIALLPLVHSSNRIAATLSVRPDDGTVHPDVVRTTATDAYPP